MTVEQVDRVLETSAEGIRTVRLSLAVLLLTAAVEAAVVLVSGSVALLADTIHNLTDALTALPLWVAFSVGRRAPNRRYTYGYGRGEDLAGIFIVATIALAAAVAGWEAVQRLVDPRPVANLGWVIAAALAGFIGNEGVALLRIRVGRRIGSAALVADGYHARVDGLASLAVVLGALGVLAGFPLADPIVGIGITITVLVVLRSAATEVYRRLMDAVDPAVVARAEAALRREPAIEEVHDVRIRWVGHQLWAEAHVVVDSRLTLAESHAIGEAAQERLLAAEPNLRQVTIHVDGCGHHDEKARRG